MSLSWSLIAPPPEGSPGHCPPGGFLAYMHVCRRDRRAGWMLLGGLGVMRVGHMWWRDDGMYADLVGYAYAPEETAPTALLDGGDDA